MQPDEVQPDEQTSSTEAMDTDVPFWPTQRYATSKIPSVARRTLQEDMARFRENMIESVDELPELAVASHQQLPNIAVEQQISLRDMEEIVVSGEEEELTSLVDASRTGKCTNLLGNGRLTLNFRVG